MKIKSLFLAFLLFTLIFASCSKSDNPAAPTEQPADSAKSTENEKIVYKFTGMDSSDYHYFVGSANGGIDKSKEILLSSAFRTPLGSPSVEVIRESKDDSLVMIKDSIITSFLNGNEHKTAFYKISGDTLYLNYNNKSDNTWEAVGLLSKNDSTISLVISAVSIYNADTEKVVSNSLSPGNFGFISRAKVFNGTDFSSEQDIKNPDDIVTWINLKLIYKIEVH